MSAPLAFEHNNLFYKAKLYIERALEEERDSDLFPFWLSLSLEFLCKSTLAKISPALLAEAGSNESLNLLYAMGYEVTKKPRSIVMPLVFDRLTKINIEFTNAEKDMCLLIIEQRNIELHSGLNGYSEFPVSRWLGEYYRICKILLKFQNLNLKDFLGVEEAIAAERMIESDAEKIKKAVLDRVQAYKKVFQDLSPESQSEKRSTANTENKVRMRNSKAAICPCCESEAVILGETISYSTPRLIDGAIRQETRYLPSHFRCATCGLTITGYAELKAIDLGSQFTVKEDLDPVEYHNIDVEEYIDANDFIAKHMDYDAYQDE
jgi:hypothetical protein